MHRLSHAARAGLGLLFGIAALASGPAAADQAKPKAVLELFTSQGCSSCPAADKLLARYVEREGVLAITLPVKLWDYLGWADTLATEINTKRQMAYSVARGDRDVYTPQLVVNGTEAMLGSDEAAIDSALKRTALPLPIDLELRSGVLSIRVGESDVDVANATIWLLVVDEKVSVPVDAGENRGRKLSYYNVVRDMRPVGIWKGMPLSLELPLSDIEKQATTGSVVIAQVDTFRGPGRIIGAAKIDELFPARTVGSVGGTFSFTQGLR